MIAKILGVRRSATAHKTCPNSWLVAFLQRPERTSAFRASVVGEPPVKVRAAMGAEHFVGLGLPWALTDNRDFDCWMRVALATAPPLAKQANHGCCSCEMNIGLRAWNPPTVLQWGSIFGAG